MIIKTDKPSDVLKAKNHFDKLINKNCQFEIKELKKQRTLSQNNSIHLYCKMISVVLNDFGITHKFKSIKGKDLEVRFTLYLVKEVFWKPIQIDLLGKESTTELTTKEVTEIAEPIEKFIAENFAIDLPFPSKKNKNKEH